MKRLVKTAFIALICNFIVNDAMAAPKRDYELRRTDKEFFTTPEAARIGEQVLAYQRVTGGWPKNIDMCRPHTPEELAEIKTQRDRRNDSTTDNNATTTQMTFLARLYQATGDTRYRDAFLAGMEYLLSGIPMADGRSSGLIRRDIRYTSPSTTARWPIHSHFCATFSSNMSHMEET